MTQSLAPQFWIHQEQCQAVSYNVAEDFCELLPNYFDDHACDDETYIHNLYKMNLMQEDAAHPKEGRRIHSILISHRCVPLRFSI